MVKKLYAALMLIMILVIIPSAIAQEVIIEGNLATSGNQLIELMGIVCIGIGVVLRTFFPYDEKKKKGEVISFDKRYISTAIGTFLSTAPLWHLQSFNIINNSGFVWYLVFAIAFGYFGNAGFNEKFKRK